MNRIASASLAVPAGKTGVCIWDAPVRLFHWLLVTSVALAAISGFLLPINWLTLHLVAGVALVALLAFRMVWGFTGSTYSRFGSFVFGPGAILSHFREIARGDSSRIAGHNPAGAVMVFAMLAVLAALAVTGTVALGGALKQGPFKSLVDFTTGWGARGIHEILAYAILVMIAAHVGGVAFESTRTRENLARSMVTGRKRAGLDHLLAEREPQALATLQASVALALVIGGGTYWLALRPAFGVPAMAVNQVWAKECAACHIAFHPSLLPAASWRAIMAGLPDHFGEDASLNAATTADITAFLTSLAAERWDTLPGNRLRMVSAEKPLEITATPFWTRTHQGIAEATFKMKPVGAKQNCEACHADAASGRFAPQNIQIPEEIKP